MIPEALCVISLAAVFFSGRRSIGHGILVLLVVGYGYGVVRANFPTDASHFIFDLAVLGLYGAVFMSKPSPEQKYRSISLQPWVVALAVWPALMFFVPRQDWLIQLVGLRGAVFFLPFLLIGARMEERDFNKVALGMAVLSIAELGAALWQFFFGIQTFFPHNAVTELIYKSNDVGGGAYRIPATFVVQAAYGGVMAFTLPYLIAMWAKPCSLFRKRLLEIAMVAASVGVFLSASRTAALLLAFSVIGIFTSVRLKASYRAGIIAILLIVGWIVSKEARLQRFTTLSDTDYVVKRVGWSVNSTLLDALMKYPMGNGLGGGGTSVPYFLQERLRDPIVMENEYARILMEQGVLGLILWIAFVIWLLVASWPGRARDHHLARLILWCSVSFSFLAAPIGIGLLTGIPLTAILLMSAGWLIGQRRQEQLHPVASRSVLQRQDPLETCPVR